MHDRRGADKIRKIKMKEMPIREPSLEEAVRVERA